jgi:hypothetical protein
MKISSFPNKFISEETGFLPLSSLSFETEHVRYGKSRRCEILIIDSRQWMHYQRKAVLPRTIKKVGHSSYWGRMTLDRDDFAIRCDAMRVLGAGRVSVSAAHENVTLQSHASVVREKKFS